MNMQVEEIEDIFSTMITDHVNSVLYPVGELVQVGLN